MTTVFIASHSRTIHVFSNNYYSVCPTAYILLLSVSPDSFSIWKKNYFSKTNKIVKKLPACMFLMRFSACSTNDAALLQSCYLAR